MTSNWKYAATALGASAAGAATIAGVYSSINRIARFSPSELEEARGGETNPLFQRFPSLSRRIPWRPLGVFPTPIHRLDIEGSQFFVKRDDLTSPSYGGNKARKLEFILGEAELLGCDSLITLGGIGSNHALATVIHGASLGMTTDLCLYDQPITPHVRHNMAAFLYHDATLHHSRSIAAAFGQAGALMVRRRVQGKRRPYFVMVGGTTRLGCLGYVSAALEFVEQMRAGEMVAPERIFVPLGTCGTAVGLLVGLKLAGLDCRVTAVQVADRFPANADVVRLMAQDLIGFLSREGLDVPYRRIESTDFDVLTDYFGAGYGHPTPRGMEAVKAISSEMELETTYTGKTLAACLDFVRHGRRGDRPVLFWNTFNSAQVGQASSFASLPSTLADRFQSST